MEENATIRATIAPMSIPVRKPRNRLSVRTATAKLPMAESKMVPFIERLITPARSDNVSPITAKTTGAAAAKTLASPMISVVESMAASYTLGDALPDAFHNQDKEHQHSLQNTGKR